MKNIRIFYLKNCHFWVVKCSIYLNRRVFVMCRIADTTMAIVQMCRCGEAQTFKGFAERKSSKRYHEALYDSRCTRIDVSFELCNLKICQLTLLLLNTTCPVLANRVDTYQLDSDLDLHC